MIKRESKIEQKLDALTEIVMAGFERVEERFEGVEGRLDQHDGRFERLENQVRDISLTQVKHSEILNKHSILLNRIDDDVELLLHRDINHDDRIQKFEKDNRLIKKHFKLA